MQAVTSLYSLAFYCHVYGFVVLYIVTSDKVIAWLLRLLLGCQVYHFNVEVLTWLLRLLLGCQVYHFNVKVLTWLLRLLLGCQFYLFVVKVTIIHLQLAVKVTEIFLI